ncbi:MAG: hypothetical protein C0482_10610 [Gordonia sp.]|nr:hypothetical protein [Gordonia sp. (in: high G+C Gram-positive bacteria)]
MFIGEAAGYVLVMTKEEALRRIDVQLNTFASGALGYAEGSSSDHEEGVEERVRLRREAKEKIAALDDGDPEIDKIATELNL